MKNTKLYTVLTAAILGVLIASLIIFTLIFTGTFKINTDKFKNVTNKNIVIKFDSAGGTIVKDVEIEPNTSMDLPEVKRDGYTFKGWYLDNTKIDKTYKFKEDVTLTANWEPVNETPKMFKITFNSNGGTKVNDIYVKCDELLKLPKNPTKSGYNFISWIDKHGTPILNGAALTCDNITLYANWEKKETKTETTVKETYTKQEFYESGETSACADDEEFDINTFTCIKK